MRWRIPMFGVLLVAFSVFACTDTPVEPANENAALEAGDLAASPLFSRGGGVVHRVSMGGADICEATGRPTGCDANFSLIAIQRADGSVTGQWQDTFRPGGGTGIHVSIDCLNVVDNWAIVGGVITHGTTENGEDVSGQRALTAVVDIGTSANDPMDQIGYSVIGAGGPFACMHLVPGQFLLNDLTHGQVKVW